MFKDFAKLKFSKMDVFVDPSYEYDAPMFVDFMKGVEQLDPEADKWFGKLLIGSRKNLDLLLNLSLCILR